MILALKTDGSLSTIWLYRDAESPQVLESLEWESGRRLSDDLLPKITGLLSKARAELGDLTGIVIFSGPGSFTSLRIGHAVANALADSLGIPVARGGGDNWLTVSRNDLAHATLGHPVLPFYGGEAHITRPKS